MASQKRHGPVPHLRAAPKPPGVESQVEVMPLGIKAMPTTVSDLAEGGNVATPANSEVEAIRKPALDYVESWYSGDAARMESAVHPELSKRFVRSIVPGSAYLDECGASKLIAWAASGEGTKVPKEYRRKTVTVLDHDALANRLAIVKVIGATGVEYLQEAKFGEQWRIVNILSEPKKLSPFQLELFSPSGAAEEPAAQQSEDVGQIRKMVIDYMGGWSTGDVVRGSGALHSGLSKRYLRSGSSGHFFLQPFGADMFIQWASARSQEGALLWGRREDEEAKVQVSVLDHSGDIASVKALCHFDENGENPVGLEYVDGVKLDGQWKGVNIISQSGPVADGDWRTWQW